MKQPVLRILFIITTIIFFFALSTELISFSFPIYAHAFEKHHVYDNFPEYTRTEINTQTKHLLQYVSAATTTIDTHFFNTKEQLHLQDVRQLFNTLNTILYATLLSMIIFLFIFNDTKTLATTLIATGITTLSLIVILFTTFTTNFTNTFIRFHQFSFTNNLWLLNPATDNLILLFPEVFFYDMAQYIILSVTLCALLTITTGSLLIKHKL